MSGRLAIVGIAGIILAGCTDPTTAPVQPVSIKADSFCEVMHRVLPPTGKPSWDVIDSAKTITDARRVGAAVDKKCIVSKRPNMAFNP